MLNLNAQCDDIRGGALERIFGCHEDAAALMDGICALLKRDYKRVYSLRVCLCICV